MYQLGKTDLTVQARNLTELHQEVAKALVKGSLNSLIIHGHQPDCSSICDLLENSKFEATPEGHEHAGEMPTRTSLDAFLRCIGSIVCVKLTLEGKGIVDFMMEYTSLADAAAGATARAVAREEGRT